MGLLFLRACLLERLAYRGFWNSLPSIILRQHGLSQVLNTAVPEIAVASSMFCSGHSLETFPKEMAAVRDAGHELGLHGYSHEVDSWHWYLYWANCLVRILSHWMYSSRRIFSIIRSRCSLSLTAAFHQKGVLLRGGKSVQRAPICCSNRE